MVCDPQAKYGKGRQTPFDVYLFPAIISILIIVLVTFVFFPADFYEIAGNIRYIYQLLTVNIFIISLSP